MSLSVYQQANGSWRADLRLLDVRCSKVKKSKLEVMKWAAERERDILLNHSTETALKRDIVLTVHEALSRYSNEVSSFKKTWKKETQRIKYFQSILPKVEWPLDRYQSDYLAMYRDQVMNRSINPLKASTVRRDFSTLSAFFSWCIEKKWIKHNPVAEVKLPPKPKNRERRIELDEVERMLTALKYVPGSVPTTKSQEVALIWLIAMATGMRSGEIVNRLPKEVQLIKQQILLPDTKNGSSRTVPLDNFAVHLWSLAMKIDRKASPMLIFNIIASGVF
jgi:integrase